MTLDNAFGLLDAIIRDVIAHISAEGNLLHVSPNPTSLLRGLDGYVCALCQIVL